jgi:hypothetical protein
MRTCWRGIRNRTAASDCKVTHITRDSSSLCLRVQADALRTALLKLKNIFPSLSCCLWLLPIRRAKAATSWLQKGKLKMDKKQTSQGAHAGVLSTRNRQIYWARFFLLAMLLTLGLTSFQPQTSAQAAEQTLRGGKASLTNSQPRVFNPPNCQDCQRALVECLAGGGGAAACGAQYNVCIESCD